MRVCKVLLAKSVYGWNFVKKDSKILVGLKNLPYLCARFRKEKYFRIVQT